MHAGFVNLNKYISILLFKQGFYENDYLIYSNKIDQLYDRYLYFWVLMYITLQYVFMLFLCRNLYVKVFDICLYLGCIKN